MVDASDSLRQVLSSKPALLQLSSVIRVFPHCQTKIC